MSRFLRKKAVGDYLQHLEQDFESEYAVQRERSEQQSAAIRDLIVNADIHQALGNQITEAYRSITAHAFVAVRSSGTAEDLQDASFAGLHDTYLDIKGEEQLLDAGVSCDIRPCPGNGWRLGPRLLSFQGVRPALCAIGQRNRADPRRGKHIHRR